MYPETYSEELIGEIGATLDDPDHIDVHRAMALHMQKIEKRTALEWKSYAPNIRIGNFTKAGTGFFQRTNKDLVTFVCRFNAPTTTNFIGAVYQAMRFDLPVDLDGSDEIYMGPARLTKASDGDVVYGNWEASAANGLGLKLALITTGQPVTQFFDGSYTQVRISGSYRPNKDA